MNLLYIIRGALLQIYRRKLGFVATCIILSISYLILEYGLLMIMPHLLNEHTLNRILSVPLENVIYLNLWKYMCPTEAELDEIYNMADDMNEIEEIEGAGTYYALENGIPALVVSPELISMSRLQDMEGNDIKLTCEGDYWPVCVGYELSKQYPVGTEISGRFEGEKIIVMQVLKQNSEWLDFSLTSSIGYNLDDKMLISLDYMKQSTDYLMLNGLNSMCYYIKDGSNPDIVKQKVEKLAQSHGIDVYKQESIMEIVKNDRRLMLEYKEEIILPIILFILAGIAITFSSIITIYVRRRDIGIMYSVGYTKHEIMIMYLVENIINVIIPLSICFTYWGLNYEKFFMMPNANYIYEMVQVMMVMFSVFMLICSSVFPIRRLSKMSLVDIIGGEFD